MKVSVVRFDAWQAAKYVAHDKGSNVWVIDPPHVALGQFRGDRRDRAGAGFGVFGARALAGWHFSASKIDPRLASP
jgi:hypothetical protein